jgi:hypothetical protein
MRASEITKDGVNEGIIDNIKAMPGKALQGVKNAGSATGQYLQRAGVSGATAQAQARAAKGSQIVSSIHSNQFVTNMKDRLDNGVKDEYIPPDQVADAVKQLLEPRIAKFVNREANQANIDKFANAIQADYVDNKNPSATIGKLYNYLVYWAQQSVSPEQVAQVSQRNAPVHDTQKAKEISSLAKYVDQHPEELTTQFGAAFGKAAEEFYAYLKQTNKIR